MGKFYWLKLPRGFFKRHDIMILESMENGQTLENLFLKLLTESIDHDGELRYSDTLPYTPKMLATICRTDEDTMISSLCTFQQLELITIDEEKTISIPMAKKMIGSAEDNDVANRQRRHREALKRQACDNVVTKCHAEVTEYSDKDVTKCHNKCDKKSLEKEIEKEKEIDIEIDKEKREKKKVDGDPSTTLSQSQKRFCPPTVEEVNAYCEDRKNGIDGQTFVDFYSSKNWMIGKTRMKDWKAAVRTWESRRRDDQKTIKRSDIPYMQKEYSKEHLEDKEQESFDELDRLLMED